LETNLVNENLKISIKALFESLKGSGRDEFYALFGRKREEKVLWVRNLGKNKKYFIFFAESNFFRK